MRGVVDVAGARKAAAAAERAAVVAAREASKRRAASRVAAAGEGAAGRAGAMKRRETTRVVSGVGTGSMGRATAAGRLEPLTGIEAAAPTRSGGVRQPAAAGPAAAAHRSAVAARAAAAEQTAANRQRAVPADNEAACRSFAAAAAQAAAAARVAAARCETAAAPVAAADGARHEAAAARAACRAANSPSGCPTEVARADASCHTGVHSPASGHKPADIHARPTAVRADTSARRQLVTAADRRAAVSALADADRAAAVARRRAALGGRSMTVPRWPPLSPPSGDVSPFAPAAMAPRVPSAADRRAAVAAMAEADRRAAVARQRAASDARRPTKKGRPWKWPLGRVRPPVAGASSFLSRRGSQSGGGAPTLSLLASVLTVTLFFAAAVATVSAVSTVSLRAATVALVPTILLPHLPAGHVRGFLRSLIFGHVRARAPLVPGVGDSVPALGSWCSCGRFYAPTDRRRLAVTVDSRRRRALWRPFERS